MKARLGLGLCLLVAVCGVGAVSETATGTITATCTPGPCGAWQTTNVNLSWKVEISPPPTSTPGCLPFTLFASEGTSQATCHAFNGPDEIESATVFVRIDKTSPRVTGASTSRAANALSWFTSPVTLTFQGTDTSQAATTSGIAACTQTTYGGPDSASASVTGTCRDRAGNVSALLTQTFKYDATPPALAPLRVSPGDRMMRLLWSRAGADVELSRSPGIGGAATSVLYRGAGTSFVDTRVANLVSYTYRLTTSDPAGNTAQQAAGAVAARRLQAPANGSRLAGPPVIRWSEVRNASYYNVQLYRGKRKILSVWPKRTNFRLHATWKYRGGRFRLRDGGYRLFVWPGFGSFARQRYGRIVGTGTFVVTSK